MSVRIGTVLSLPGVEVAELAATALDLVWVDLEHGALDVRDVQATVIAAQSTGCEAHVRIARGSSRLGAILDIGVHGIVAPSVEHPDEAAELVAQLRYPPAGRRGFGPRRVGGYGRHPVSDARVECTVQIESVAGVEHVAAIARVPGVDALVVGCADLSHALGFPGDLGARPVRQAVDAVAAAAKAAGVRFGIAASADPPAIGALAAGRADLVVYSVDVRLFSAAVDAAAEALHSVLEEPHAAA